MRDIDQAPLGAEGGERSWRRSKITPKAPEKADAVFHEDRRGAGQQEVKLAKKKVAKKKMAK